VDASGGRERTVGVTITSGGVGVRSPSKPPSPHELSSNINALRQVNHKQQRRFALDIIDTIHIINIILTTIN
jgi:hypothetical protein